MKPIRPWMLVAAYVLGAMTFGPAPTLPDIGLPNIGWFIPIGSPPPFKTDKLSVLVIEESSAHGSYTPDQLNIIQSTDAKSLKAVIEGKGGRFAVLDKDNANALTNAAPWVKEAFPVVSQKPPPWIAGATQRRGFSVPMTTEADAHSRVGGL